MENTPKNKRFVSAIIGTSVFLGLMILFDKFTEPETFMKENYWPRILVMGVIMFLVYFFLNRYKDLTWKELFARKK